MYDRARKKFYLFLTQHKQYVQINPSVLQTKTVIYFWSNDLLKAGNVYLHRDACPQYKYCK